MSIQDTLRELEVETAKMDMAFRFPKLLEDLWWRFMPGRVILAQWPSGDLVVGPDHSHWDYTMGATNQLVFSADPNDHFRPWLEEHVGKQGWDWDWKLDRNTHKLAVKFRKGKEKWASIAALLWG